MNAPRKALVTSQCQGIKKLVEDLFFTAAKQVDSLELKNRLALAET
jgi:hypothetical protein